MNFLAHAFLAGPDPALRLGGVIGDFVKGPLPAGLPVDLAAGALLHRRIDSFAETQAAFCRSRSRIGGERRRYAGILVDLFYDHLLARRWDEFSGQPLEEFAADTYAGLAARADALPEAFRHLFPVMRDQDWLASYRSLEATGAALDRMALRRLRRPNPLAGSIAELRADYDGFDRDFGEFMAAAQAFAAAFRAAG